MKVGIGLVTGLGLCALGAFTACGSSSNDQDDAPATSGGATASGSGGAASIPMGGNTSSLGGSAAIPASVPIEQFEGLLTQALCRILARCTGVPFSQSQCSAANSPQAHANFEPELEAIRAGHVLYDPVKAHDVLQRLDTISCEQYDAETADIQQSTPISGTVADGGACTINAECRSLACFGASCPGSCGPRHAAGEACSSADHCQAGLACVGSKCAARKAWGAPCATGDVCASFTMCTTKPDGSKACLPFGASYTRAAGQTCASTEDLCQTGLACRANVDATGRSIWPGTCVAPVAAGADCGDANPDMCPEGHYCVIVAGTGRGTCETEPVVGEACGLQYNFVSRCASGLSCVDDVCREPKVNGTACLTPEECASENCVDGSCEAEVDCG